MILACLSVGPDTSLERCLQAEAASFLLDLRDKCNATDIIFTAVTSGTDALLEITLDIIQVRLVAVIGLFNVCDVMQVTIFNLCLHV